MLLAKDVQFREGAFTHLRAQLNNQAGDFEPIDITDALLNDPAEDSEPRSDSSKAAESQSNDGSRGADEEKDSEQSKFRLKSITDMQNIDGAKKYRVKWVGYSGGDMGACNRHRRRCTRGST